MNILFMGRKKVAADVLIHLLEAGHNVVGVLTDSHLAGSKTAAVATRFGVPLWTLEETVAAARAGQLTFDLGLSVVYWRILPEELIDVASRGVINFHPAPLPDFRGTGGYNLAILEGLRSWGTTAHYVDAGIDTGPIIDVAHVDLDPDRDTAQSLEARTMEVMARQIREIVSRVVDSVKFLPSKPNIGGRYISRKEMEGMKKVVPGDDVDRKIRAFWFPPYSGATVEVEGVDYTLVNSQILASLGAPDATSLHTQASVSQASGIA